MREQLSVVAQERGQEPKEVEKHIVAGDEDYLDSASEIVGKALDEMTRSESERRVEAIRQDRNQ